jgi:hypothetical protein
MSEVVGSWPAVSVRWGTSGSGQGIRATLHGVHEADGEQRCGKWSKGSSCMQSGPFHLTWMDECYSKVVNGLLRNKKKQRE